MIGTHIGRFRITAPLGRGGIATVWRAHDELLGRDVALKILSDDVAQSPKARQRFVHEARATAMLDHPGIITIHDSGESQGRAYIAYSLVDGDTVADLVSRRLMPVAEAVRIATAACDALDHAHARGVIHRDVTARNIMVARDGRVIVLDFGLALAAGMTRLTTSESAVGTVAYMAPEEALGKGSDARSDLYGLGVVTYEMLTGGFPFAGERPEAMIYAVLNQVAPPPSAVRAEVPAALDRIVLRAIERDPETRYPRAAEMLADLKGLDRGRPVANVTDAPPAAGIGPTASRPETAVATLPHPLYLAVQPFEVNGDAALTDDLRAHVARLAEPLRALLSRTGSVRPVTMPPASELPADLRELARAVGANAVLRGCVSVSGTRMRVTWGIVDPERGVQWGGDAVDGSTLLPFELQDAVAESIGRALGLPPLSRPAPGARPPDPAAAERFTRAQRYLERHENEAAVDGAITILEQLIASEGDSAERCAWLARACIWKHRLSGQHVWQNRAATACARAVELDAGAPAVLTALADLHREAGRLDEAIPEYQRALEADPESFEAHYGLSWALELAGRFEDAEVVAKRLVVLRPRDWRAHHRLGSLDLHRGEHARAAEHWEQASLLAPDNARVLLSLGTALYRQNRFEEALSAYRESVAIQPNDTAFTNLGSVLWLLGRHDEAIDAFEKAIALTPANPNWWGNLGNACRWLPGREARAAEALDRAIALMQERMAGQTPIAGDRARLADWLSGRGRIDEALALVQQVLQSSSLDGPTLLEAGHVLLDAGRRQEALGLFRDAVRHGYGVEVLRRSPAFQSLRDDPEFRSILADAPAPAGRPHVHHPESGESR